MATSRNTFTREFICPPSLKDLRYFAVAAAVGLPKGLFLGRLIVRAVKPTGPVLARAASLVGTGAGRRTTRRRSRGGKKK